MLVYSVEVLVGSQGLVTLSSSKLCYIWDHNYRTHRAELYLFKFCFDCKLWFRMSCSSLDKMRFERGTNGCALRRFSPYKTNIR